MIMQEAWGRVGKQGAIDTVVFAALLPFSQLWLGVLSAVELSLQCQLSDLN